jgi:hypothetical protein
MAKTSTYIVTYISADKLDVGPQHIRQSWEAAVAVAADVAIQMNKKLDRETVEAELLLTTAYTSEDEDWAVVIGQPDTEE